MELLSLKEKHEYESEIASLKAMIAKLKPANDDRLMDEKEIKKKLHAARVNAKRWKDKYDELVKKRQW